MHGSRAPQRGFGASWPAWAALTALATGCGAVAGVGEPDAGDGSLIASFTANPPAVLRGQLSTLTATFIGEATLAPGLGPVASGEPVASGPLAETTTFTLTVTLEDRTETAEVTVEALDAPFITSFASAPPRLGAGRSAALTAVFGNGAAEIDGGVGIVSSGQPVSSGPLLADQTFTLTVRNAAATVTQMIDVDVQSRLWVANFDAPSVTRHALNATGDLAPLATLAGPGTGLVDPSGVRQVGDELYVTDQTVGAVFVYPDAGTLDGEVAPVRTLGGPLTTMSDPRDLFVHEGELYVVGLAALWVFPADATGDMAPLRTLTFPNGGDGIDVAHDGQSLYVSHNAPDILVWDLEASDPDPPTRTIRHAEGAIASTLGLDLRGDELFVSTTSGGSIFVFDKNADGDVAPRRSFFGDPEATSTYPGRLEALGDDVYVLGFLEGRVLVFPWDASGEVPATRRIEGATTGLAGPWALSFAD